MSRVVWITGLPGSGKTTLAKLLQNELKARGEFSVLIDGDDIRALLGNKYGFDRNSRESLARIYQDITAFLIRQDVSVIVSTVSLFHWIYESNREVFQNYFEIFLDVDQNSRIASGRAMLYGSISNVPGVSQEIQLPINPNLILALDSSGSRDHWVDSVLEKLYN
jgi:adenylylsulfate kinase-like enzyme